MSAELEFFYDYVSPYSYLANAALGDADFGKVRYRPMLLGAVMQATGNRPPASVEAKGRYLHTDLQRWAAHYGVPLTLNTVFPQNTMYALRLAIVADERGDFDDLHRRLFTAMFIEDRDLSRPETLEQILGEADLDASAYLAGIEDPDVKAKLKANTEEAVARGAFGAPTFFVGEQMFFGNDRFEFIREAL